jgi:hypothetical protein
VIYIEKGKTNNIVLTLSETSKLTTPNFLFIFLNEYNLEAQSITFSTPDISSYTNRYNQFIIVESATGSSTGGYNVPLKLVSGQYKYTVYEGLTASLDINNTTGVIIEEGRMVVSGDDDNIETITNSVYL